MIDHLPGGKSGRKTGIQSFIVVKNVEDKNLQKDECRRGFIAR